MTAEELKSLKAEFPEVPVWIVQRAKSLEEARALMALRREAFPKTVPGAA